jgi:hypothetical protein
MVVSSGTIGLLRGTLPNSETPEVSKSDGTIARQRIARVNPKTELDASRRSVAFRPLNTNRD